MSLSSTLFLPLATVCWPLVGADGFRLRWCAHAPSSSPAANSVRLVCLFLLSFDFSFVSVPASQPEEGPSLKQSIWPDGSCGAGGRRVQHLCLSLLLGLVDLASRILLCVVLRPDGFAYKISSWPPPPCGRRGSPPGQFRFSQRLDWLVPFRGCRRASRLCHSFLTGISRPHISYAVCFSDSSRVETARHFFGSPLHVWSSRLLPGPCLHYIYRSLGSYNQYLHCDMIIMSIQAYLCSASKCR